MLLRSFASRQMNRVSFKSTSFSRGLRSSITRPGIAYQPATTHSRVKVWSGSSRAGKKSTNFSTRVANQPPYNLARRSSLMHSRRPSKSSPAQRDPGLLRSPHADNDKADYILPALHIPVGIYLHKPDLLHPSILRAARTVHVPS